VPQRFDGFFVSNEFPTFDVDETLVDAPFLAAYFRSREVWDELARLSHGLGSRRQRVHPEEVLALEILLPPRDVQRAVVEQVERLGEARRLHVRVLDLVTALESAVVNRGS